MKNDVKFRFGGPSQFVRVVKDSDTLYAINQSFDETPGDERFGSIYKGTAIIGTSEANKLRVTKDIPVVIGAAVNATDSFEGGVISKGTSVEDIIESLVGRVVNPQVVQEFTVEEGKVQEAKESNIGQVILLQNNTPVGEVSYEPGPYIVTGIGAVAKMSSAPASGDVSGVVAVLEGKVSTLESKVITIGNAVKDLKVKDVDPTPSNGIGLNLSPEGKVAVNVDLDSLADSIAEHGVTAKIKGGSGIIVDKSTGTPVVAVKIAPNSAISATEAGLDINWSNFN